MAFFKRAQDTGRARSAFCRIYTEHFATIYRFVYARVRSQVIADDITQDVFTKSFAAYSGDFETNPLPYLYRVARNALIDRYRKKKELPLAEEAAEFIVDESSASDDLALARERANTVETALATLGEEQRTALTLLYMEELSISEVARIMGKKEETLRQMKSRALRALRKYFDDTYGKDKDTLR